MRRLGFFSLLTPRRVSRRLAKRADQLRDANRFREAAELYEAALAYTPEHAGMHIQCGHMHKENGALDEAERHYLIAAERLPGDADLALQFGHLYKISGRFEKAIDAYRRALDLKPSWPDAAKELEQLASQTKMTTSAPIGGPIDGIEAGSIELADRQARLVAAAEAGHPLQTDLFPRPAGELLHEHREGIAMRRLGRSERGYWGTRTTLRGIEAIRGFCISATPITEVAVLRNASLLHRGPVAGGYPLKQERWRSDELRKYPFNVWLDFGVFPQGPCAIEVRVTDARGRIRSHRADVIVAEPLQEADIPYLDGLVSIDPEDPRSLEEQINARPTMIRPAKRALLSEPPKTILVQRIDQLGDMVVSVPALRRLRELYPEAKIVGLLSNANADLARSLELFDEVLVTDFPEDWLQRRRIMPMEKQEELLRMYAPYKFDMAIDMSENGWARRVLLLSGAPFLYGFRAGDDVPGLTVDLEGNTHDRLNGYEIVPHTNKMLGLMEWLGALTRTGTNIVPRTTPSADALAGLGLSSGRRYLVLHDGARLQFSRWPHFNALATRVLAETDLDLAMLVDDQRDRDALPSELLTSDRFRLMPQRLAFDAFDALLANCAVFVGNDSGPKHLASLRGSQVVSIHSSRTNWNEWGQESTGFILSRKMPCAGCMVHYDPEECGLGFPCVRDITVDEVFGAVLAVLREVSPRA